MQVLADEAKCLLEAEAEAKAMRSVANLVALNSLEGYETRLHEETDDTLLQLYECTTEEDDEEEEDCEDCEVTVQPILATAVHRRMDMEAEAQRYYEQLVDTFAEGEVACDVGAARASPRLYAAAVLSSLVLLTALITTIIFAPSGTSGMHLSTDTLPGSQLSVHQSPKLGLAAALAHHSRRLLLSALRFRQALSPELFVAFELRGGALTLSDPRTNPYSWA